MSSATARIQHVLHLVDREIWIVTSAAGGRAGGLVATWVSATSIDPENSVVLIGLAPNHFTTELVKMSGGFALHLLRETQLELVWRFGLSSGREVEKLAGLAYQAGSSGSPALSDCLAWLDCRVIFEYDAGDRLFFWAEIMDGKQVSEGKVLCEKQVIAAATTDKLGALRAGRLADIEAQRPLRQQWFNRVAGSWQRQTPS